MPQSVAQKTQKELLSHLAELGGKLTAEEDIVFSGSKLILPEKMELREAVKFLQQKLNEDENETNFSRTFNYRPWDGARATMRAFQKTFGTVAQKGTQTLFGENPPRLITISVSATETEQVPWGNLILPHLPGAVFMLGGTVDKEYGPIFQMMVSAPRKFRFQIEGIFRLVQEELETDSLYRGKAFDGQTQPQFLDLSGVDPTKVIYSEETMAQLDANVWSVLRYPDALQRLGVPLKRAILLEGPYGTGKTLAAFLTAQVAVEEGWTFLLCRPGQDDLMEVMSTARLYQPAVVFFEDVDSITGSEDHIPRLLDVFDGIKAKNTRIITVLTTNHAERIHKAMVRPGRLDAVIHVGALDAAGFERLVRATVPPDLLDPDISWPEVVEAMEGYMPAFAREAIDRAVRYNVARNKGEATQLSTPDFVQAAQGLRSQLSLMEGAKDIVEHDPLSKMFTQIIGHVVDGSTIVDSEDDYVGAIKTNGGKG